MYGKIFAEQYARLQPARWLAYGAIAFSMGLISLLAVRFGLPVGMAFSFLPLSLAILLCVLRYPIFGFALLFCVNYFIIPILRYTGMEGLSIIFDLFILLVFLSLLLNVAAGSGRYNRFQLNGLVVASLIWAGYCSLELLNPSAMTEVWIRSRGISFYMLAAGVLTLLVFRSFKELKMLLYLFSVLTLIGAGKGIVQQVFGFDPVEQRLLIEEMANTHLLASGTRYFSIFASAGIFGAVMGHAMTVFGIAAIYFKGWSRPYFLFVAAVAFYGLAISGTRGAIAVPAFGLVLFAILSRRARIMIPTFVVLIFAYIFLAMTTIGHGNRYIRRMRTVFDPNEPSLVVRKNNQRLFADYLRDKPFGEGLGLSGGDARQYTQRYTTTIPTDSWYVKIWVETGVVGLCLHIAILLFVIIYGSYIILFKIRDDTLRGVLAALLSGVFGIIVASYGNQVLGQYPVALIVYTSMGLVFLGPKLDKRLALCAEGSEVSNDGAVHNISDEC